MGGADTAFSEARRIRELTGTIETPDAALLFMNVGISKHAEGNYDDALVSFWEAHRIRKRTLTLETAGGMQLLTSIGSAECDRGDLQGGIQFYAIARGIAERLELLETHDGERLLTNTGAAKRALGDLDGSLEAFSLARKIREGREAENSSLKGLDASALHFLNGIKVASSNSDGIDGVLKGYGDARLRRKAKHEELPQGRDTAQLDG